MKRGTRWKGISGTFLIEIITTLCHCQQLVIDPDYAKQSFNNDAYLWIQIVSLITDIFFTIGYKIKWDKQFRAETIMIKKNIELFNLI